MLMLSPLTNLLVFFDKLADGYSLDQTFDCDETGLYYKMLPVSTLSTIHSDPSGTKKAKERIAINACSNASGFIKLPLLFIGKVKYPRCFRKTARCVSMPEKCLG